jgi:thioesterase domain-containing protein
VALIAGYRPKPVGAPTLVVGARDSYDLDREWSAVLGAGARAVRVDGDHYSFLQPPAVHDVATAIRGRLDARPEPAVHSG